MADRTKIEWCDATVNFWAGCTKVSPACDHCYAEKMAGRIWGLKWGPGERRQHFLGAVETLAKLDRKAHKLGTRLSVFINSLSDLFDNEVDDADRMDAFEAMAMFRNLVFLVLTKRIGNVLPYLQRDSLAFDLIGEGRVWLGITVCNQPEADRDIPKLLAVPAARRFLSVEPLLGPVRLGSCLDDDRFRCSECDHSFNCTDETERPRLECPVCGHDPVVVDPGHIDWVIVGGESGPNARPMHPDWARSLRDQCQAAGVPFFFKQWGEWFEFEPARCEAYHMGTAEGKRLAALVDGFISKAGEFVRYMDDATTDNPYRGMSRIGKKAAGRLLDGVEHNGFPS